MIEITTRADQADWQGRARREAALLLEEVGVGRGGPMRSELLDLLAAAWLRGAAAGTVEVQELIELEADRIRRGASHDPAA